jgi:hypothetical protein
VVKAREVVGPEIAEAMVAESEWRERSGDSPRRPARRPSSTAEIMQARERDDLVHSESTPDGAMPADAAAALDGELIEPGASLAPGRPPGRKPVPPLHVIPPLTAEEISMLTADPNELLRRRTADYVTWAHNLVSASPSRLNRVAFAIESQRRMLDKLLSLAVPPARQAGDQFGDMRTTPDAELLAILASLGPDPSVTSEGHES